MALFGDKVDYVPFLGSIEKETIRFSNNQTIYRYPLSYCHLLILNTKLPEFKDINVRRALSLLIDRESLKETHKGLVGTRVPTSTIFNFSSPATEPTVETQDTKEAIMLFRNAGYHYINGKLIKNKKQLSINLGICDLSGTEYTVAAARLIAKFWENAGIECKLIASSLIEIKKNKKFGAALAMINEENINETFEYLFTHGRADAGLNINYSDKVLNELVQEYDEEFQDDVRLKIKLEIQERLKVTAPIIPLFYDYGIAALGEKFKDKQLLKAIISKDPYGLGYLAITK